MATSMVDINRYRGRFFEVLPEAERSQTAVMTIGPGEEAGPVSTGAVYDLSGGRATY